MRTPDKLPIAGGTNKPVRVLVVDDHEDWIRFVSQVVELEPAWRVIGEALDGLQAVDIAQQLKPDLVLLDIGLPILNGLEAARRILEASPRTKILFVSENRSRDIADHALNTGADGYVVKSDANSDLVPAIRAVIKGKRFVSASLTGQILASISILNTIHTSQLWWIILWATGMR